jgi:2-polyprenyl-3-methyl-5-hydroxy-6-metoxy-1,4-benzoquinol methylase
MMPEKNIEQFSSDIESNKGYLYTDRERLSCVMSNRRISEEVLRLADLKDKSVIDIGCGDGTYTFELSSSGAGNVLGVDASEAAIMLANEKASAEGYDNLAFAVKSIYELSELGKRFDIAVIRGVLHHLYNVKDAVREVCKVADTIIFVEPNGYNPVVKILEKLSPYHVAHEEKSYPPHKLDRWFKEQGAEIITSSYINLVPMFCPDIVAKICKTLEPVVERIPLINNICCGQYVQKVINRTRVDQA